MNAALGKATPPWRLNWTKLVSVVESAVEPLTKTVTQWAGQTTQLRFIGAETLEKVTVDTVEAGFMTKDLALLVGPDQKWLTTIGYLDKVDANLQKALG